MRVATIVLAAALAVSPVFGQHDHGSGSDDHDHGSPVTQAPTVPTRAPTTAPVKPPAVVSFDVPSLDSYFRL